MAVVPLFASAGTVAVIAADVTNTYGSTSSIIVGAIAAVVVAVIAGAVQLRINRRRNSDDDPQLTTAARLTMLEFHVAEIQRAVQQIEDHVRPWGPTQGRPK